MIPARKWSRIGPQTIPGPELTPPQKVRNTVDSIIRMDLYIFNYPRWRKDKYLKQKKKKKTSNKKMLNASQKYRSPFHWVWSCTARSCEEACIEFPGKIVWDRSDTNQCCQGMSGWTATGIRNYDQPLSWNWSFPRHLKLKKPGLELAKENPWAISRSYPS